MCGSLVSNISTSIKNCIRSVAALKMAFNRTTIRNLGVGQKFHNVRLAQTFDTLQACFLTSDCRWMAESMVAASLIPRPRIQQHAQYVCKTYEHVMFDIIEPHAFRKYSTCCVFEKSEEPCKILKKFVHACVVNVIHAKVFCSKFEKFEKWLRCCWVCNRP